MADYYIKLHTLKTSGPGSPAVAEGEEIAPPVGVGATTMAQMLADPVPQAPINHQHYLIVWST